MFSKLFRRNVALERQLSALAKCGVALAPSATIEALLEEFSRENYEKDPYRLLLCALGNDELTLSENVWHFDTECIEDHGAYVRIADRLRRLAGDDLPLLDIEDFVDVEQGKASLSFKLDGQQYDWQCDVEDDWVDPKVLTRFADVLEDRDTGRRFTYVDLEGQDCLIGCSTNEQRKKLADTSGLKVTWLT
jgi:hypothetical protein